MSESIEKDGNVVNEAHKKKIDIYLAGIAGFAILVCATIALFNILGYADKKPQDIYAELKDYQSCKVVTSEVNIKITDSIDKTHALICELSPTQQKSPESVQLAQKKVVELNKEIKSYKEDPIKELKILLDDDFVRKNPERAIDNIVLEMKDFELCLTVSTEEKLAIDCSFKEPRYSYTNYNEVEKIENYYQKQTKINHQLSLINKKYFQYFKNSVNKQAKIDNNLNNPYTEIIYQKLRAMQEIEMEKIKQETIKAKNENDRFTKKDKSAKEQKNLESEKTITKEIKKEVKGNK